jgi:hypothetical protein
MSRPRASAPRIYAYTFRVRILGGIYAPADAETIWREIELRGDQTLADLGEVIPSAFRFDDDHLWSFFLSGKTWDESTEYARVQLDDVRGLRRRTADRLRVRDAPAGREFLFLFDYGDEWHFGVKLARTSEIEPSASYPRIVASHGPAPRQYPDVEDWDEEDEGDEAYQEERERLLERFEAWAERRGASEDTWLAPALLDYKWDEVEEELTYWTTEDLEDVLLEWCPQTLVVPEERVAKVIPAARAFMSFLDDAGLLDPESDRYGALDATLDWIALRFEEAMRDASRFSPAKAAVSAMRAEGVDLSDSQAVDQFLSEFELPEEVSLAEEGPAEAPFFRPVALPSLGELQVAAAAAPALRRLRELTEWVGEGRELTAKSDDPGFDFTLAWARELRLVRTYKGRLLRVKGQRLLDDPLELFNRAFDALPRLSSKLLPRGVLAGAFPNGLAGAVIDLLAGLYVADEPVLVEQLADHVWVHHSNFLGAFDETEPLTRARGMATADEVRQLLAHLQEMGVTEGAGLGEDEVGGGHARVRLTPLGFWKTNVLLRAAGAEAPAIGDLAGEGLEALLDGVAGYDEAACRAELRAWCQERGGDAVRELAAYARTASSFERQMMAFVALEEAGPAAEAEVRAMLDDRALRPQAQMWLVQKGLEDERSLDPESGNLLMARTLVMLLDTEGPAALVDHLEELGPPEEQMAMMEDVWRATTPRVREVLEAISKAHPVPKVAKSARTAAFKRRSAGLDQAGMP